MVGRLKPANSICELAVVGDGFLFWPYACCAFGLRLSLSCVNGCVKPEASDDPLDGLEENMGDERRFRGDGGDLDGLSTGTGSSPVSQSCGAGRGSGDLVDRKLRCFRARAGREGRYLVGELPIGSCCFSACSVLLVDGLKTCLRGAVPVSSPRIAVPVTCCERASPLRGMLTFLNSDGLAPDGDKREPSVRDCEWAGFDSTPRYFAEEVGWICEVVRGSQSLSSSSKDGYRSSAESDAGG